MKLGNFKNITYQDVITMGVAISDTHFLLESGLIIKKESATNVTDLINPNLIKLLNKLTLQINDIDEKQELTAKELELIIQERIIVQEIAQLLIDDFLEMI